jgi:two-component system NtrC family sensor kinase
MLCIGVDITEHKLLEAQAKRMDRLATLGQLLSGIAHELKNPLFIITGRLHLLKEKLQSQIAPDISDDVRSIIQAAERMTKTVEQFLQLAKPIAPTKIQAPMEQIVQRALNFLANELIKNQITVIRDFPPNLPQILTDPHQIEGVLLNLILNAIQAMASAHGRGTLTITIALVPSGSAPDSGTLGSPGPWVETRIQDDGPGIPPEHQARLFEPFFTTKPPEEGTGLGLWVVRSTVVMLQGTVHCTSEVGHGATFTLRLPAGSQEPEAAGPSQPAFTKTNSL